MRLVELRVKNVRTHDDFRLPISPSVTLITGANGTGKTSLLEAVYIAFQGSSFKGGDADILKFKAPWYRIDITSDTSTIRSVKFDPARQAGKKQFSIDNKTQYRLSYINKYPVVLFEPDELRLVSGSPTRRRAFIDRFISQFDLEYSLSLRRYDRALKQRNNLLKKPTHSSDLFVWDVALSKYGAYIIQRRIALIEQLQPLLAVVYKDIAHSEDEVVIEYSSYYKGNSEQRLLSELHQNAKRDALLGYTSVGPHRHDILFKLNGTPAAHAASRGEIRTIVLALKFLEVDIVKENTDRDPIILLDDVFSELDESRQKALMERFASYQTIITSVTAPLSDYPTTELSH